MNTESSNYQPHENSLITEARKTQETKPSLQKSDSGMEDSFPDSLDASQDSDDECIGIKKRKKIMVLDDSDEDADPKELPVIPSKKDESDGEEGNDDVEKLQFNFDNENKEDEVDNTENDEIFQGMSQSTLLKNSDIFDAEESDSEEKDVNRDDEDGDNASEDRESEGDEGFNENDIDPAVLAKLKKMKGASKSTKKREKTSRKSKSNAEQMMELHSESQRLYRESRVNLPYHEPEKKSLNDFLARTAKKKAEYSSFTKMKDIQKARIINEKLSVKPPSLRLSKQTKEKENSFSSSRGSTMNTPKDSGIITSQASTVELTEDELPDLSTPLSVGKNLNINNEIVCFTEGVNSELNTLIKTPAKILDATNSKLSEISNVLDTNPVLKPSLTKDPSRDLFLSQSTIGEDKDVGGVRSESLDIQQNVQDSSTLQNPLEKQDNAAQSSQVDQEIPNEISKTEEIVSHQSSQIKDDLIQSSNKTQDLNKSLQSTQENSPQSLTKTPKQRLIEKLKKHGLSIPETPKLSESRDSVVVLDKPEDLTPRHPAPYEKLIDKLTYHVNKKTPKPAHDVSVNVVEKVETEGEDGQELQLKSITYHVRGNDQSQGKGSKLSALKQQLGVGMKEKRQLARDRRLQMYALENEEGYGEEKADDDAAALLDEEEMTDKSDTDVDDDEDDEEQDVVDFNKLDDEDDDGEDYNPFVDKEAGDEDEDGTDYSDDDYQLHVEKADNEDEHGDDETDNDEDNRLTILKKKKKRVKNSSPRSRKYDEESESQPWQKNIRDQVATSDHQSFQLFSEELTPVSRLLQDSQPASPDLYGPSTHDESESHHAELHNDSSQSVFHAPSQILDADGFLKLTQTQKPKSRISFLTGQDDNMARDSFDTDELTAGKIFAGSSGRIMGEDDASISQMMAFCSGQNTGQDNDETVSQIVSQPFRIAADENKEGKAFTLISDDDEDDDILDKRKRIRRVLSDSEDDEEGKSTASVLDNEEEEEKEEEEESSKFNGFRTEKGIRKEFLEVEAELSGSEFDSDENEDIPEEEDILEAEEGDLQMAGVSEEALRDEVGRVHMKQLQDDDDREVMRFKEMYLQDGDLYSDSAGRMRNFRWKNIDNSQQDLFSRQSDEEQNGEDEADEEGEDSVWRKQRFEREKFMLESQEEENTKEDSQISRFGQLFLKKRDSAPPSLHRSCSLSLSASESNSSKSKLMKKGSFLGRSKDALAKLVQVAKGNNSSTTKNSRNFVFQSMDSQGEGDADTMPEFQAPPKRKAHSAAVERESKKPKLSVDTPSRPSVKRQNSIFKLLKEDATCHF